MRMTAPGTLLATLALLVCAPVSSAQTNVPVPERRGGPRPQIGVVPEVFTDLSFDEAERRTRERDLFLIVVSAAPNPNSKKLDLHTWTQPVVIGWLERNALLVRLESPKDDTLIQRLRLTDVPTCVALVDGVEVGRFIGFRSPSSMPAWFATLSRSDGYVVALSNRVRDAAEADEPIGVAALDLAQTLLMTKRYEEAREQLGDLWKARTRLDAIDRARLAGLVASLARTDAQGEAMVRAWRRALDEHDMPTRVMLNAALGETDATRAYLQDPARKPGDADALIESLDPLAAYPMARIGELVRNANPIVDRIAARLDAAETRIENDPVEWRRRMALASWRADASRHLAGLHATLLAAGRDDEARLVSTRTLDDVVTTDPTLGARALIAAALEADSVRTWHLDIIERIDQGRPRDVLSRRVREALGLPEPAPAPEQQTEQPTP